MSAAGLDRPQVVVHVQQPLTYTVFDCKWVPRSARLLCLGSAPRGTGLIQLYELRAGRLLLLSEIEKAKPIKCATFGAASLQQRHLATGDFAGCLSIWNLEAPEVPVYSVKGHKEIINCIDGVGGLGIGEGAPEIVTGSRDGTVKVWDPRQKETPVANMEPAQGESKRDCWTVAFGNAYNQEERVVCAGYDNGDIKLFDLKAMSLRWETNIKNGVCSVEFDRKDVNMNKLVATSLEGKFHVFDMRTQHPTKGFASVSEKVMGRWIIPLATCSTGVCTELLSNAGCFLGTQIHHLAGSAPPAEQGCVYDERRSWEPSSLEIVSDHCLLYNRGIRNQNNCLLFKERIIVKMVRGDSLPSSDMMDMMARYFEDICLILRTEETFLCCLLRAG
uniref:Dynein axonemal assembly factor 10 n=1 Tax=Coturnix japonica TaxID=93934 RepID=A0A8C2TH56_COTJA